MSNELDAVNAARRLREDTALLKAAKGGSFSMIVWPVCCMLFALLFAVLDYVSSSDRSPYNPASSYIFVVGVVIYYERRLAALVKLIELRAPRA